jgi:hypothetical protein
MPIIATRASAAYGAGFAAITAPSYLGPFGAYDSLATVLVPSGGLSSVTFSGIPTGYKHLEIRMYAKFTALAAGRIRFNNDSSAIYSGHSWHGAGSNPVGSTNSSSQTSGIFTNAAGTKDTAWNIGVFTILDYASTTKNKVSRGSYGWKRTDGTGYIEVNSSGYHSLDPITSILIYPASGSFVENSHLALYGVK